MFFNCSGTLSYFFCPVNRNFSAVSSKLHSNCRFEHFEKKKFRKSYVFSFLSGPITKTFWHSCTNIRWGLENSILRRSPKEISKKISSVEKITFLSFSDFERKPSGPLSVFFLYDCSNLAALYESGRTVWEKQTIGNIVFHFPKLSDNLPSGRTFSAGLSELHSVCPVEHFVENFVSEEFVLLFFHCRELS